MKATAIGGVAVAGGLSASKESDANPILWWLGKEMFCAAVSWVIGRVVTHLLDRVAGDAVDAVTDTAFGLAERTETFRIQLVRTVIPELPQLNVRSIHRLHVETIDQFSIPRSEIWMEEKRVLRYDSERTFGVKSSVRPIDLTAPVWLLNQKEAETGDHGGESLLANEYRLPPSDKTRTVDAFKRAVQAYDLDYDIKYSDVSYVQTAVAVDGRDVFAFGLKEEVAKATRMPALLI